MPKEIDPLVKEAVLFMQDSLIPYCIECFSIRDLATCVACTDENMGMWCFCPSCLAIHFTATPECAEVDGGDPSDPVAPDFRFTHEA